MPGDALHPTVFKSCLSIRKDSFLLKGDGNQRKAEHQAAVAQLQYREHLQVRSSNPVRGGCDTFRQLSAAVVFEGQELCYGF